MQQQKNLRSSQNNGRNASPYKHTSSKGYHMHNENGDCPEQALIEIENHKKF